MTFCFVISGSSWVQTLTIPIVCGHNKLEYCFGHFSLTGFIKNTGSGGLILVFLQVWCLRWLSGSVGPTRRIIASVTIHGQGSSHSWPISAPLVLHVTLGPMHFDGLK
jgi:hypothetical protein